MRLLLDADLSPKCAAFLVEAFGFDAVSVYDVMPPDTPDEVVAGYAAVHGRLVITFDVGFGELFYRFERGRLGVIVLRISDQMAEPTDLALKRPFESPESKAAAYRRSLVIVDDRRIRVSTASMLL